MMLDAIWGDRKATTTCAAALTKTDLLSTILTEASIILCAAKGTALCSSAILLSAYLTEIALLGDFNGMAILLSEFYDARIALTIIFSERT
jgi:hypothetical protein